MVSNSSSLRDYIKSLNSILSKAESNASEIFSGSDDNEVSSDLYQELISQTSAYLDRHDSIDGKDSQRLQEELLTIYNSRIEINSSKEVVFFNALILLRPCITSNESLIYWANLALSPALDSSSRLKLTVKHARDFLFDLMVYDLDNEKRDQDSCEETSQLVATSILRIFLQKDIVKVLNVAPGVSVDLSLDERQMLVIKNSETMLRTFGQHRAKVRKLIEFF